MAKKGPLNPTSPPSGVDEKAKGDSELYQSLKDLYPPDTTFVQDSRSVVDEKAEQEAATIAVTSNNGSKTKRRSFGVVAALRILFLDAPLVVSTVLFLSTRSFHSIVQNYLLPQLELQAWDADAMNNKEYTYYTRRIRRDDLSTNDTEDLIVPSDMSPKGAADLMHKHGAVVFPDLISKETASEVRDFILEQNLRDDSMISVLNGKQRWSFGIRVDQHPSIPKALKEILNRRELADALEEICGEDPAVVEFTGITAANGASTQGYHQDVMVSASATRYARNFVPTYSLFIPLQDTTASMGATDVCPGSHMIGYREDYETCMEHGFQVSGKDDLWPTGFGALIGQQTSHRGPGHYNDQEDSHRVLFILTFAPRPRVGERQLETRQLGIGGSYSLHWSQWGHTLQDFQDPERRMKQPWRLLRTLGIYKLPGTKWGWDYPLITSGRIANEDGWYNNAVERCIDEECLFFLPKWLYGDQPEDEESITWLATFYAHTVERCSNFARLVFYSIVGAISLLTLVLPMAVGKTEVAQNGARRMVLTFLIFFVLEYAAMTTFESKSWAKNIKARRSFNVPNDALAPELRSTLVTLDDVLMNDHMKSAYLASFSEAIDKSHPGNQRWKTKVNELSNGFDQIRFSQNLQQRTVSTLLRVTHETGGRILTKNNQGMWAVASSSEASHFAYKELYTSASQIDRHVVSDIDQLSAESMFGYWSRTAMHQKHNRLFLRALSDRIIKYRAETFEPRALLEMVPNGDFKIPTTSLPSPPGVSSPKEKPKSAKDIYEDSFAMIDFFEVGDFVEANYKDNRNEWFPGLIVDVSMDENGWVVQYEDGDEDIACFDCVRPFFPYHVGELIQCRFSEDENPFCRVTEVEPYRLEFSALVVGDDTPTKGLTLSQLTRYELQIEIGKKVQAPFGDPSPDGTVRLLKGVLEAKNPDGTYAVRFDDEGYVEQVYPKRIIEIDQ